MIIIGHAHAFFFVLLQQWTRFRLSDLHGPTRYPCTSDLHGNVTVQFLWLRQSHQGHEMYCQEWEVMGRITNSDCKMVIQ